MTDARDWINTRSGVRFTPLDPRVADVRIGDIAFALSNLSRYGGHSEFYSVAEHSFLVCRIVAAMGGTEAEILAGLLHDAPEAYIVDIPSPVKYDPRFAFYREAEAKLAATIAEAFGLVTLEPEIVKRVDAMMIQLEAKRLHRNRHPDWVFPLEPSAEAHKIWRRHEQFNGVGIDPYRARCDFIGAFERLTGTYVGDP